LKNSGFRQATFYIKGTDGLDASSPGMQSKSHRRRHYVDCDGCSRENFFSLCNLVGHKSRSVTVAFIIGI
jgi:hypothetical protein